LRPTWLRIRAEETGDDVGLSADAAGAFGRYGPTMRARPSHLDVAVAAVLTALALAEAALGLTGDKASLPVLLSVPLVTGPVAWRRTHPQPALVVLVTALVVQAVAGSDLGGGLAEPIALLLGLYAAGAYPSLRASAVLLATAVVGVGIVVAVAEGPRPGNFVYAGSVVLLAWASGRGVAMARERATLLAEHRTAQERSVMARELHDVVTHALSAMVIQAAAERRDLPAESSTAEVLGNIEDQGREALRELRRLLGLLRLDSEPGAPLAPQPGLDDLPRLIDSSRRHGLEVTLSATGSPRPLGPGAELALYRIVQESLTNAAKHARDQRAEVSLVWRPDAVEVEVLSHGHTGPVRHVPGSGFGLRSMAERVQAYGGALSARATADGFQVQAHLPLDAA
jgi:signal transduction histidine kinase